MSKKIHTVQSSDKKQFDKQINQLLELGCELHDNGYEVIKKDNDIIYSQVIVSENCELKFFNDGQLEYFSQLNKDGKWTSWNENGQKEYEETWKNDKRDGLFTRWFPNGVKESEGTYKDGKEDGNLSQWAYWYEDGTAKDMQKIAEATEDAVISAIRAGLETYATEQLMDVGRRSWPTNPWDGLETKPAGYWDTDENAADDGEWRFNTRTENITHMRADNTIWHWDYDKGTQSGSNAATGSFGSRQEGVGD